MKKRIIGTYDGERKGPLVICLAGIHGNEKAGIKSIQLLLKMLQVEHIANPDFLFSGKIVGLRGNLPALAVDSRFLDADLNRIWSPERVIAVKNSDLDSLLVEEREMLAIDETIRTVIADYQPEKMVIIDLHTTSAEGGIFSIVSDRPGDTDIAIGMFAPVITKMQIGISGTTMDYFTEEIFGLPINCIVFEAGQHENPLAVNMSIAAMVNCLRAIGCVKTSDVENRHDEILKNYSKDLPPLAELIYNYKISEDENFVMKPGFKNFEKIEKNQWLASNEKGKILAEEDGLMLMPRYQKKGSDGFFIIKQLSH